MSRQTPASHPTPGPCSQQAETWCRRVRTPSLSLSVIVGAPARGGVGGTDPLVLLLTFTFSPPLLRPFRKASFVLPLLPGLLRHCLSPLWAIIPPPSGQRHGPRPSHWPLILSLQAKPPLSRLQVPSPVHNSPVMTTASYMSPEQFTKVLSLRHVSIDLHSHTVRQVSSYPRSK